MKTPRVRHGVLAEARTAKRLSARQHQGSGAMGGLKGDMQVDGFVIENKATEKGSISIPHSWLAKISGEALEKNAKPALSLQFVTGDGRPKRDGAWVMVPEWVFKRLIDESQS